MVDWNPGAGLERVSQAEQTQGELLKILSATQAEAQKTMAQIRELNKQTNASILDIYYNSYMNKLRSASRSHALYMEMLNDAWMEDLK